MAHATPADLTDRFDARTIADLASDTGEPVENLNTDAKVLAALDDASGRFEAAVLVSNLYSTTDLSGLTGNSLALKKRIVCDLAMVNLLRRRPERFGAEAIKAAEDSGEAYLEMLRKGQRLFDVDAAQDAGLPDIDGPTTIQYSTLNLIPDRTKNFYPFRATRLPTDRR